MNGTNETPDQYFKRVYGKTMQEIEDSDPTSRDITRGYEGTNEHEGREIGGTTFEYRIWNAVQSQPHGSSVSTDYINHWRKFIDSEQESLREQLANKDKGLTGALHKAQETNYELRKQLALERALNNDLKQEITYLKVTGSLLVDNDGEADLANKLYQAQTELGKERALRKELVEVYEQWVKLNRIPNSLIHRFTPLIQKSKSLDDTK